MQYRAGSNVDWGPRNAILLIRFCNDRTLCTSPGYGRFDWTPLLMQDEAELASMPLCECMYVCKAKKVKTDGNICTQQRFEKRNRSKSLSSWSPQSVYSRWPLL
jgi:hypothetical protein